MRSPGWSVAGFSRGLSCSSVMMLIRVLAAIEPNDSVARFEKLGVRVIKAAARFTGPNEVEAGGTQRAPPELETRGVVAEQPEVAGAGAGSDARSHGLDHAGDALGRKAVEVGRVGFLELRAVLGVGVSAEAVHHHEHDLGVGGLDQRVELHGPKGISSRANP